MSETRIQRLTRILDKEYGIRTIEKCGIDWEEKDFDLGVELKWLLGHAQAFEFLSSRLETTVPYVLATIGPGNTIPAKNNPDWVEVHSVRLGSSRTQLEKLLALASELKK